MELAMVATPDASSVQRPAVRCHDDGSYLPGAALARHDDALVPGAAASARGALSLQPAQRRLRHVVQMRGNLRSAMKQTASVRTCFPRILLWFESLFCGLHSVKDK